MLLLFLIACLVVLWSASAITLAVDGRKRALNAWLRNQNVDTIFTYHLYTNAAVFSDNPVLADFAEATFPGYGTFDVGAANWDAPTDDGTCATCEKDTSIVWTATGASAESSHGYFVTDGGFDGALLWVEPFPAAIDMTTVGKTTTLFAAYQCRTGAPC